MRNVPPVTQKEFPLADDVIIMSITDPQSRITYVNDDFVAASGFERSELTGQFHRIVRHPDMPREVFADMWATLQRGESWTGLIKNRRKNGDHYWVRANATPIEQDGRLAGYTSVRVKPARTEVEQAEALYRRMRQGQAAGVALRKGVQVRTGWRSPLTAGRVLPMRWRIRCAAALPVVLALAAAPVLGLPGSTAWCLLLAAGAALNAWLLEAQLDRPLRQVLAQAQRAARGQASEHLALDRIDEVGMLARAVDQASLNMRSLVKDVLSRSSAVAASGGQLRQASADLAARSHSQASAVEETAAAMEQLAAAARQNTDSAHRATQHAESAGAVAGQCRTEVERVVQIMDGIGSSCRRIADFTSLIDTIAFQTNILSLNAAVEAARAGGQARGFSVIAGQVRALSRDTSEAASAIKKLVGDSVARVAQGSQAVAHAGATMEQVVGGVNQVTALMREIRAASGEQTAGVQQVGSAVTQIEQVTHSNARMVQDADGYVGRLQDQARDLVLAVSVFKARQAGGRVTPG